MGRLNSYWYLICPRTVNLGSSRKLKEATCRTRILHISAFEINFGTMISRVIEIGAERCPAILKVILMVHPAKSCSDV